MPMPAVAALSVNLLDISIHCWDLARATGQPHGLTGEQVTLIDAIARRSITDDVRNRFGFGPALSPTDDTPLATMLAFVGRHP